MISSSVRVAVPTKNRFSGLPVDAERELATSSVARTARIERASKLRLLSQRVFETNRLLDEATLDRDLRLKQKLDLQTTQANKRFKKASKRCGVLRKRLEGLQKNLREAKELTSVHTREPESNPTPTPTPAQVPDSVLSIDPVQPGKDLRSLLRQKEEALSSIQQMLEEMSGFAEAIPGVEQRARYLGQMTQCLLRVLRVVNCNA